MQTKVFLCESISECMMLSWSKCGNLGELDLWIEQFKVLFWTFWSWNHWFLGLKRLHRCLHLLFALRVFIRTIEVDIKHYVPSFAMCWFVQSTKVVLLELSQAVLVLIWSSLLEAMVHKLAVFHFRMNCLSLRILEAPVVLEDRMDLQETLFQKDLVDMRNSMHEEGLDGIIYEAEDLAEDWIAFFRRFAGWHLQINLKATAVKNLRNFIWTILQQYSSKKVWFHFEKGPQIKEQSSPKISEWSHPSINQNSW